MKPGNTVISHILDIVAHEPGCRIEDMADLLPDLTLKEVVYTLCYLSSKDPTSRLFN